MRQLGLAPTWGVSAHAADVRAPLLRFPPPQCTDSWRFRAFSTAATGLLRPTLLRFYAHATEHTRRLAGVEANAKFSGPVAGPDSGDLNVSKVSVASDRGSQLKVCRPRYEAAAVAGDSWQAVGCAGEAT